MVNNNNEITSFLIIPLTTSQFDRLDKIHGYIKMLLDIENIYDSRTHELRDVFKYNSNIATSMLTNILEDNELGYLLNYQLPFMDTVLQLTRKNKLTLDRYIIDELTKFSEIVNGIKMFYNDVVGYEFDDVKSSKDTFYINYYEILKNLRLEVKDKIIYINSDELVSELSLLTNSLSDDVNIDASGVLKIILDSVVTANEVKFDGTNNKRSKLLGLITASLH